MRCSGGSGRGGGERGEGDEGDEGDEGEDADHEEGDDDHALPTPASALGTGRGGSGVSTRTSRAPPGGASTRATSARAPPRRPPPWGGPAATCSSAGTVRPVSRPSISIRPPPDSTVMRRVQGRRRIMSSTTLIATRS